MGRPNLIDLSVLTTACPIPWFFLLPPYSVTSNSSLEIPESLLFTNPIAQKTAERETNNGHLQPPRHRQIMASTSYRDRDPGFSTYKSVLETLTTPSPAHIPLSLPVSPARPHIPSHNISSLQVHPVIESALHLLNLDLPSAHFLLRHMQAKPAWEAMYLHGILHRLEGDLDNARAWYRDVKNAEVFQAVWGERDGDTDRNNGVDGHGSSSFSSCSSHADGNNQAFNKASSFLDQVESYKSTLLSPPPSYSSKGTGTGASRDSGPSNSKSSPTTYTQHSKSTSTSTSTTSGSGSGTGSTLPAEIRDTSLAELSRFLQFCERKFGTDPVTDASSFWTSMADKHKDQAALMITGGEGWRVF